MRAKQREDRKPKPPRGRVGDAQDDQVTLDKVGQNPFKKEKIVSKFDVNDIRKVEFVGSYDDKEEIWPRVSGARAVCVLLYGLHVLYQCRTHACVGFHFIVGGCTYVCIIYECIFYARYA